MSQTEHAPLVSVVICTYNRPRELRVALESLEAQTAPEDLFEVIVVDNGPFRSTREVAAEFSSRLPLRYVVERETGLDHARNCGFREAAAEHVAYLDDDSRPTPSWVEEICKIIQSGMAPAAFGGPCPPYYRSPKPEWFRKEYDSHSLGPSARRIQSPPYLFGGNLIVRRSVLEELGGFRLDLDMKGTKIAYGGDSELQTRIVRRGRGEHIWYFPQIVVHHLTSPERMTLRGLLLSKWKRSVASVSVHRSFEDEPVVGLVRGLCLSVLKAAVYTPYLGHYLLGLRLYLGNVARYAEALRLRLSGKGRANDGHANQRGAT